LTAFAPAQSLDAKQLSQAWAYARAHPVKIDTAIAKNKITKTAIRRLPFSLLQPR
jgi:hypothetical protein